MYYKDFMVHTYIRGFTKFGIEVLWRLQFLKYLRTLSLKFQKARTKIKVVLSTVYSGGCLAENVRSSSTPEPVAFTIPWYQTWWNPQCTMSRYPDCFLVNFWLDFAVLVHNSLSNFTQKSEQYNILVLAGGKFVLSFYTQ